MASKQKMLSSREVSKFKSSTKPTVGKKVQFNGKRNDAENARSKKHAKSQQDKHDDTQCARPQKRSLREVGNFRSQIPVKSVKWTKASEPLQRKKTAKAAVQVKPDLTIDIPMPCKETEKTMDMLPLTVELQKLMEEVPEGVVDIDSATSDMFMCKEYAQDIVSYLRKREDEFVISADYLNNDPGFKPQMRAILVDWLVQVQAYLEMFDGTLQIAVQLLDQFLSKHMVLASRLQLVGVACLFIAAKLEERFPPEIATLTHLTQDAYTYDDVTAMEMTVLKKLEFNVCRHSPETFVERLCLAVPVNQMIRNLCYYLLDLILTDKHCIGFPPSLRAAASLCMARHILKEDTHEVWTPSLEYYSTYKESDLLACLKRMANILLKVEKSRHQGAREKFACRVKFGAISTLPALTSSPVVHELSGNCPASPQPEKT